MAEGLPEVIAHHFTEAGLASQATAYWLKAGREAIKRSANLEALDHIRKGLGECHKLALSDRVAAARAEIDLLGAMPAPLIAVSGWSSPELETVYARAKELCVEVGSHEAEFQIGLGRFNMHLLKSEIRRADEIADSLIVMAKEVFAPDVRQAHLLGALRTKALAKFYQAKFAAARTLLDQMMELYDAERHAVHAYLYGAEPAAVALSYLAWMDAVAGQRASSEARLVRARSQATRPIMHSAFAMCNVSPPRVRNYGENRRLWRCKPTMPFAWPTSTISSIGWHGVEHCLGGCRGSMRRKRASTRSTPPAPPT